MDKHVKEELELLRKRIRELRIDHDETQEDVAKTLDTSQTMIARYERGATAVPVRHVLRLCRHYGITSDYLLGLSGIAAQLAADEPAPGNVRRPHTDTGAPPEK